MKNYFNENDISAFVFDMDGVLLDSETVYEKAWRIVALKMGLANIDEIHKLCLGQSEADVFKLMKKAYGENFDAALFWKMTSEWSLNFMNENGVPKKNGAEEILNFLKSKNIPLALSTSSGKDFAEKLLKNAGLFSYFDVTVFGDEVVESKPNPEIYLKACEKLSIKPEACVGVEDSFNGIKSAFNAGLKCVMVPDRIPPDEEIKKICWKISPTLADLKRAFE